MTLQTLEIEDVSVPFVLTEAEQRFIADAMTRAERLRAMYPRMTSLLISDPVEFCRVLRILLGKRLLRGASFCEWGCGIGLMSGLAAMNGLSAYGIETEQPFIQEAESLSREFALDVALVRGSFVPPGLDEAFRVVGTFGATQWASSEHLDVYQILGKPCSEMDLIYAYPWPREVAYYEALFDLSSSTGAILWLFSQGKHPKLLRKL